MVNRQKILSDALSVVEEKTTFKLFWQDNNFPQSGEAVFLWSEGALKFQVDEETNLFFMVIIRQEIRQYQLNEVLELSTKNRPLLLIVNKISDQIKAQLRSYNVSYIDVHGNVFVKMPNHFIWIDGQKSDRIEITTSSRAFTKSGLRLIFYLLVNKEAINFTYRRLSEITGVSIGNITNVMNSLLSAGYVVRKDAAIYSMQNKKVILQRWLSGYAESLRPSLLLGRYRVRGISWKDVSTKLGEDFWGGEPAAELLTDYLKAQELILYTNQTKVDEVKKLKVVNDLNGHLTIYQKFWNDPVLDKEWYVPPLLVYTDLVLTDDPRCIEVAQMIYNQFLKDEFEEPERRRIETGV